MADRNPSSEAKLGGHSGLAIGATRGLVDLR